MRPKVCGVVRLSLLAAPPLLDVSMAAERNRGQAPAPFRCTRALTTFTRVTALTSTVIAASHTANGSALPARRLHRSASVLLLAPTGTGYGPVWESPQQGRRAPSEQVDESCAYSTSRRAVGVDRPSRRPVDGLLVNERAGAGSGINPGGSATDCQLTCTAQGRQMQEQRQVRADALTLTSPRVRLPPSIGGGTDRQEKMK